MAEDDAGTSPSAGGRKVARRLAKRIADSLLPGDAPIAGMSLDEAAAVRAGLGQVATELRAIGHAGWRQRR